MAPHTSTTTSFFLSKIFRFTIAIFVMLIACSDTNMGTIAIFAEAASPDAVNTVNINKMFKGMSPGMQRKMSFMALTTTSKIDSEEEKAAIRKQFQRTFQKSAH